MSKFCKDCLHYKMCRDNDLDYDDGVVIKSTSGECLHYTARSEWIHLPCRLNLSKELYRYMFDDDYNKIVVKCKVGEVTGYGFELIHHDGRRWKYGYDRIGKTVFLTREEAEKALEEKK